jgi:mono/diheme cytochrome c family protein
MFHRPTVLAITLFLAQTAYGQLALAQAEGDVAAGRKATDFLCRNCHDVSGNEIAKSPPGGAPSFYEIAQAPATTAESLYKFLRLPHGRMVNVLLTGKEVDDAAAYILSLKRK